MAKHRKQRQQRGRKPQRSGGGAGWILAVTLLVAGALMVAKMHAGRPGGDLNAQGLRVSGEGRSDASLVVAPAEFSHPRVQAGYAIAQQIPATLNQLYCWCGCIERIGHRSALECFESEHAAVCDVCLGTAEVAWEMKQQGVTDPGRIQKEVDRRFGRGV